MNKTGAGQGGVEAAAPGGQAGQEQDGSGWRETGEELGSLKDSFRSSYQDGTADGPSRDEVARAIRTLGGAVTQVVSGAGNTLKDPTVKQQVKKTTRSALSALAGVLAAWTSHLRGRLEKRRGHKSDHDVGSGSPEAATPAGDDDGSSPATKAESQAS